MSAFYDLASLVLVPSGYKASKVYAQKPLTTDGQLTFSRASTATRVNSAGLIETVSSNVPRLDYQGSTCPKLLLEPSRTNVMLHSNDAGSWNSSKSGSFTANAAISPDGTQNAFSQVAGDSDPYAYQNLTLSAGTYTYSCYLKGIGAAIGKSFSLRLGGAAQYFYITSEWTRFTYSVSVSAGSYTVGFEAPEGAAVGDTIYGYGFQLELGSYVTSVIPTTSSAVTRLADACSKTGISSLIGQTEGTLFIDVVPSDLSSLARYISIEAAAGVGSGWIGIFAEGDNTFRFFGDGWDFNAGAQVRGTRYKVAMAYKNGVLTSAYINGTSVGTLTANTTGKSYANLKLANAAIGNLGCSDFFQSLIFKTALTNAQLAELTAL